MGFGMVRRVDATMVTHFSFLKDPRVDRTKLHPLINILVIALSAIICGAEGWTDVELFGQSKRHWLAKFLDLSNGIPSHDTFGRVFAALDAEQFQVCFANWVQALCEKLGGQVVAIDGKTLRHSHDQTIGREAIHMVSAWATESQLVLAQTKVDAKSNEITAIPAVLKVLDIMGCIVTIDAIGCQKEIASQIVEQGADYVLALKANQGTLHNDVKSLFVYAEETNFVDCDYHKTVGKGHGRVEIRECWTISDAEYFAFLDKPEQWSALQTIAMVRATRRVGEQVETETRYYISSLPCNAEQILAAVRQHWHIENCVHWVLDVTFREDDSRIRSGNAPQNMAVLRHMALNLIKREQTSRRSIRAKRLKAGWDEDYLTRILCAQ
jgi:predicted transposase YbfD/YdcC